MANCKDHVQRVFQGYVDVCLLVCSVIMSCMRLECVCVRAFTCADVHVCLHVCVCVRLYILSVF